MKKKSIMAAGLAATLVASTPAWGFSFDDIHYWVGDGTNKCAVVINWNGTAKAWGYRWNNPKAKLGDAIRAIASEDYRLCLDESYGYILFLGYDIADSAARFDTSKGYSTDTNALAAVQRTVYLPDHPYAGNDGYVYEYWAMLKGGGTSYDTTHYSYTALADSENLGNDNWYSFSYGIEGTLHEPSAAETPYGYSVVSYKTDARKTTYTENNPQVVLGRPTDTTYDSWMDATSIVSPAVPAFGEGTALTLENLDGKAYVTIAFDHDVVDDPANPFGVDFIVFGNAGISTDAGMVYPSDDPEKIRFEETEYSFDDPGKVEVSQDGINWYECSGFADTGTMPTLSRVYDPGNPDSSIYEGNSFWGARTNPCYPVDPAVKYTDCYGMTFAELCRRYNGSAGGKGFDISELGLPRNSSGIKWFRYVRISNIILETAEGDSLPTTPEVDAVADVAPVSGYKNWVCNNFTWDKAWQTNLTASTAVAANGLANGLNYVYGLKPTDSVDAEEVPPFKVVSFEPGETEHVIKMLSPKQMTAVPKGLVVKATASLDSGWKSVVPTLESSESQGDGTWLNTFKVPKGEAVFFKLALDE